MKRLLMVILLMCPVLGGGLVGAQDEDALPALVQLLGQVDDPQFHLDILKGIKDGLEGRREVRMPAGWEAVAAKLRESPRAEVRELVQGLSLIFGSSSAMTALRKTAIDPAAPVAVRRRALESLLAVRDGGLAALARTLLGDPAMRAQSLRALAAYDDPDTPAAILTHYPRLNVAERQDALNTLASRLPYARALLRAVREGQVAARDLTAGVVRQLRAFGDESLGRELTELWGVSRETDGDKVAQIEKYKALVRSGGAGDVFLGRAVFSRTCQQCHILYGVGGKVGPDITGSNRGDLDYILQNAVDPNATIPNDYRTWNLETSDDRFITGIVTRQDATSVSILTANDHLVIPRKEIVQLEQGALSMMPEGLLDGLKEEEVRGLIAYLATGAQVPMLALPENAGGFFNGEDLAGWEGDPGLWRVEEGEIVGRTPGLERDEWLGGGLLLGDFRMVVEMKLTPAVANSGIQFRSERLADGEVRGYEAGAGAGGWGRLLEVGGRGLLREPQGGVPVKPEDWNRYEIVAVGDRILTAINGQVCVEMNDPSGVRRGIVAFQAGSGGAMEVRFRKLELELNPTAVLRTVTLPAP